MATTISRILSSYLIFILLAITLTGPNISSSTIKVSQPSPLASLNLANLTDQQIHEYCVAHQILNHRPALKSLQSRETISLNGPYEFCFDRERQGLSLDWPSRSLRLSCKPKMFLQMPVPSAFNSIPSIGWAHDYIGLFWYQRTFSLYYKQDEQVFLQFESVNYLALVWLQSLDPNDPTSNATFLGSHVGGHLPFVINMSRLIDLSDAREPMMKFRLTVAVNNKLDENTIPSGRMVDLSKQVGHHYELFEPDFDFFHFAGILGPVNVVKLPPLYLAQVERIPKMHDRHYHYIIWLEVCLSGDFSRANGGKLMAKLHKLDEIHMSIADNTRNIFEDSACYTMFLQAPSDAVQDWKLANGNPNHIAALYSVSIELYETNSRLVDVYVLSVAFGAELALTSGGHQQQLQGFGLHQEQPFSGRTMSLPAIMKDIYLLKQMGTNLVRTSHYPYSSEFLDACDQHGLLVIAESPAVGLNTFSDLKLELHKQILLEMMERDNHHPSIMMWSIANEPSSELKPARSYFKTLIEFARTNLTKYTIDANRSLTAAIAQSERADLIGQMLDVVMVNRYMGWYEATGVVEAVRKPLLASLCGWAERLPGKPLLISEFGAEALVGLHRWSSSHVNIYSEEYQRDLLLEHEQLFDELWAVNQSNTTSNTLYNCSEKINFVGSMIWNFADFSTDISLTRIGGSNRKGIFTIDREPKLAAEAIKEVYLKRLSSSGVPIGAMR